MSTHDNQLNHNRIRLIALDLDGTLLCDDGSVSERNVQAIQTAVARNIQVIIATGKSRASAAGPLARLGLQTPGVYTQGVMIHNADGSVRYAEALDAETAVQVITFAAAAGLAHHAYCGARILTPYDNPYRRRLHEQYHEPLPEVVGPLLPHIKGQAVNKLLVSDKANNGATRARLAALVSDRASITQAVADYIEILPAGASKGRGVRRLLADLAIDPAHVLAIGDGENDLEMVQMAGIGVAMGNGAAALKAIADDVVPTNNESGVAVAIERYALNHHV